MHGHAKNSKDYVNYISIETANVKKPLVNYATGTPGAKY